MKLPRLELDYVRRVRRGRWLGWLLLVVALGIATDLTLRFRTVQQDRAHLEAMRGLLAPTRPAPKPPAPERLDEQVKAAEAAVRQLTLPWGALIGALESAGTADVALLQVAPQAEQRQLQISAEARNHKAMLEYVRKLTATPMLRDVHWTSHQVLKDDPQRPLQFSVHAAFRVTP